MAKGLAQSPALAALSSRQISVLSGQIPLGPHGRQLLSEILTAGQHQSWLAVIILSATLADVALYEESWSGADSQSDTEADYGMGLDWLSRREREKLDWLRGRRNRLVHYEGPVDGLLGQADDVAILARDADRAVSALLPLLDGLEQF